MIYVHVLASKYFSSLVQKKELSAHFADCVVIDPRAEATQTVIFPLEKASEEII
jgi:hypothetical protein